MNKNFNFIAVLCCIIFVLNTSSFAFCAENADLSLNKEQALIKDEIVENILKERTVQKPYVHLNYNYKSTIKIPVRISAKERIKSENDVYVGQVIEFEAENDVFYKGKLKIKKGDTIKAKVGTIITSGMNGIPASIIFEDFEIAGLSRGQISNSLEVFGQDRSLIVFPLKWALTILPPTGSLKNFIMGGHVKINQGKTITINYFPERL